MKPTYLNHTDGSSDARQHNVQYILKYPHLTGFTYFVFYIIKMALILNPKN